MKRIAVFPGSFDPVTIGHADIVMRSLPLFEQVIVAIGNNTEKKFLFALEQRQQWIQSVFSGIDKIRVMTYEGLTVDFCKKVGASYILRGLRTSADFEFERSIAQMNHAMAKEIETVFMISRPEYSAIASTIVRDIVKNGGDASPFVPSAVILNRP